MRAFAALVVLLVALAPTASAMMNNIEELSTERVSISYTSTFLPTIHYETPAQQINVASSLPDVPRENVPVKTSEEPVEVVPTAAATVGVEHVGELDVNNVPQVEVQTKDAKAYGFHAKIARADTSANVYTKRGALDAPPSALPLDPTVTQLAHATAPAISASAQQGAPLNPEPTTEERRIDAQVEAPVEPDAAWPSAVAAASLGLALLVHFLLYHRMRGSAVLENGTRERLLAMLRERPGLAPADAARELGIDPSTALYHLRRLVKEGIAVVDGAPRANRYFATGTVAPDERARVVAERDGAPFLTLIRTEPGVSKTRLAERAAIARATVSWHLDRLHKAGLVRFEREGREVKVYPAAS